MKATFQPGRAWRTARPVDRQLGTGRLLRFAAFAVPVYAAAQPMVAFIPAIYSKQFGIPLSALGLIYLVGQVLNSLLDPVIGALSDRTTSRFGKRRPWIAGGAVLFMAGSAMLFFPPATAGAGWVGAGVLLYYLGSAISTTTLLAWSGEISGDYAQRTRVSALFTLLSSLALVAALLLPTIADQLRPNDGPLRLTLFGLLVLVAAVPGLILTLTAFPDSPAAAGRAPLDLGSNLRAVFGNRLLLRVLASDIAVTTGQGIRTALLVFVVTIYFQRPEWAAGFFLFQYSFGVLAGPIWQRIGVKLGRPRAAVLGELVQSAINLGLLFVTPDRFGLMLFRALAQGLSQGSGNLMLRGMVADVADHHRLETSRPIRPRSTMSACSRYRSRVGQPCARWNMACRCPPTFPRPCSNAPGLRRSGTHHRVAPDGAGPPSIGARNAGGRGLSCPVSLRKRFVESGPQFVATLLSTKSLESMNRPVGT